MPAKPHADSADNSASQLEHAQLTSLISSMADGVLAVDHFTKVVVYNGAALNILDVNQSIAGKALNHILNLVDHNNQPVDAVDYVRNIKLPTVDESMRHKYSDGSIINLYLSVSPVTSSYAGQAAATKDEKDGEGDDKREKSNGGYVIVLRDITSKKSLEEERDEFISVVSHELRTPIAIAEGNISNAQFVADKLTDFPQIVPVNQALKEAHDQILFLSSMINDLSTLSRAERGKLVTEIEHINVHDLMLDLAANYKDQAVKKGLALNVDPDPQLELLESSKLYVREVLQNFITNAIKYTERGSVTIGAKPHVSNGSHGVLFSVSDTGIGISHGDQERIFDKFYRSEDYRTRKNNGTGLGLYITMKLARLLHAEIDVSSQLNHGSTFTIFVPDLR